jgi:hypothetical protein
VTEAKLNVPAPVDVKLVGAVVPPTMPPNVLAPVAVTVRSNAPLIVLPKLIVPDPVETVGEAVSVTAPVEIEKFALPAPPLPLVLYVVPARVTAVSVLYV